LTIDIGSEGNKLPLLMIGERFCAGRDRERRSDRSVTEAEMSKYGGIDGDIYREQWRFI